MGGIYLFASTFVVKIFLHILAYACFVQLFLFVPCTHCLSKKVMGFSRRGLAHYTIIYNWYESQWKSMLADSWRRFQFLGYRQLKMRQIFQEACTRGLLF